MFLDMMLKDQLISRDLYYVSNNVSTKEINLLLLEERDTNGNKKKKINENKAHYVWIKNMPCIMRRHTKDGGKVWVCARCLQVCSSIERLNDHTSVISIIAFLIFTKQELGQFTRNWRITFIYLKL